MCLTQSGYHSDSRTDAQMDGQKNTAEDYFSVTGWLRGNQCLLVYSPCIPVPDSTLSLDGIVISISYAKRNDH